jgi:hypothetical protein
MKAISLVGVLLIVVGVLVLAYQGINYTRQKKVLDVGSVHLTTEGFAGGRDYTRSVGRRYERIS